MIDPRNPDFAATPVQRSVGAFAYRPSADDPWVSVVTPFYNAPPAEFLETARSLLGQSLQAFEWIIVDDASSDAASLEALQAVARGDRRVRVVRLEENAGPSAARNRGYAEAACELVFQLDADDLLEPTAIEKCAIFATAHPHVSFVNTFEVGFGAQEYLWQLGFPHYRRFLEHCPVGAHTVLVRRSAHRAVGGYDESIRGGMEDWEFWLRCAASGRWGATIPEYLCWYRRRENHESSWENWDNGERQRAFHEELRRRYATLWDEGFSLPRRRWPQPLEPLQGELELANPLAKDAPRLLMIVPWLRMGGADKFNLDLVEQLSARGWEVTLAATREGPHGWLSEFSRRTADVFLLEHLAPPEDMPRLLRYLVESRRADVVMVSGSEAGYMLLPWLRSVCPQPAYVDYNHIEESYWRSGGHPRSGAAMSDLLDMHITASHHLRGWMVERGAHRDRIEVATINVDPGHWKPDGRRRQEARERLGLDPEVPVILYAGRLCPQKQPHVFGATMRELDRLATERGEEFVALVAGDGELRGALEGDLREHRLLGRRVRMLGEVASDDMRDLLAASDIFFLPSRWEGIALVFYEAMASGVVPVGADVGGQRELVTPECGVLLPKAEAGEELRIEPRAYADALIELLCDGDRRAAMAAAARRRVERHFALDDMGERMDALLRRAIDDRSRRTLERLPERLAEELAVRAIESLRLSRACDRLWNEHNHRRRDQRTFRSRPPARKPAAEAPAPGAAAHARRQLQRLNASRAWRLLQRAKRSRAYRAYARARWGGVPPAGGPRRRLERISASRSYRVLARLGLVPRLALAPPGPRPAGPQPARSQSVIETHPPARAHNNGTAHSARRGEAAAGASRH